MKKRVDIESPFMGKSEDLETKTKETQRNIKYARCCVRDSLMRGEAPYASHLLYTQPGILDDNIPEERTFGIDAGLELIKEFDLTAVYIDLGISRGMKYAIEKANKEGRKIEERTLGENWEEEYNKRVGNHSHNGLFA